MLQTSDFERSDRNRNFKSNNFIIIPRIPMPEDYLASAVETGRGEGKNGGRGVQNGK